MLPAGCHVIDPHLRESSAVLGALETIVVRTPGEAVPHHGDIRADLCGRPIGIPLVRGCAPEVGKALVVVFDGDLQTVVGIEIHDDLALIKTMLTIGKIRLHDEGIAFLLRLHLKHRRVVVVEVIVGPSTKISRRLGDDVDALIHDRVVARLARSLPSRDIHVRLLLVYFPHALRAHENADHLHVVCVREEIPRLQ